MPNGSLWSKAIRQSQEYKKLLAEHTKLKTTLGKSSAGSMDIALLEESLATMQQALDLIEAGGDGYDPKPDIAKAREAADAMQAMLTDWKEAMEGMEEEPESEEIEAGKTGDDMEYQKLRSELAQAKKHAKDVEKTAAANLQKLRDELVGEKVTDAFTQLHAAGKITAEDRATFDLLAKHQGLDKAIAHFSARPEPMTPANLPKGLKGSDDIGDVTTGQHKELFQSFFDRAIARGVPKEQAEAQAKLSVKLSLNRSGGN